jgi:hypothetical protein
MLGSEYSWLFDFDAGQQMPDYLLDAGTHTCADGGDILAGFDLSSVAQEPSTSSTTQMNNNQQPLWIDDNALSIESGVNFVSLFTDATYSAPNPDLDPAVVGQNVGSLPSYQDSTSAHQEIDAELFYRNAQSPLVDQYVNSAVVSQHANLYDTSAALSMQHAPGLSLREELERSLLEEAPCVLDFEAGPMTEFGNANEGLQLDHEQPQQDQHYEPVEPLTDTSERLNKQDARISELELALQQLQQPQHAGSELPQTSVPIP